MGPAINGDAESVEVGVHRGLSVSGAVSTADFDLSAPNPVSTAMSVESLISLPVRARGDHGGDVGSRAYHLAVVCVFTPSNEPYLGLEGVGHFDEAIQDAMAQQDVVGPWTRTHDLDPLQRAACEIVPGAVSIALATRELVRQGYLGPGFVLLRSLIERAGTLNYLIDHPDALAIWEAGWPHGKRPSFTTLLDGLTGGTDLQEARVAARTFHSLVHGDPASAGVSLIRLGDGSPGFTSGKDTGSPKKADLLCLMAVGFLTSLILSTRVTFPEALPPGG